MGMSAGKNSYVCVVTITKEQRDWVKENDVKMSHVLQDAIDVARGKPNPFLNQMVTALVKKLKEDGAC